MFAPQAQYLSPPSRVVNEAIDMLGQSGKIIGDIQDGTPVAETARRYYGQGLRQLLRVCPWDFARKRDKLTLLGDASGSTPPLGVSSFVECPWTYAYAWPNDGVMGRWLPWTPTQGQPTNNQGIPLTTGNSTTLVGAPLVPGRFLVASSDKYPVQNGVVPWDQQPDLQRTEGLGPIYRQVILTDCCNADFVYTRLVTVIEEWDALFRQAFVTMLALALVNVAVDDPKQRLAHQDRLIPLLKNAVADARVANGNESGMFQSTDTTPDWITARSTNYPGGWNGSTYPGFGGTAFGGYTQFPYNGSLSWCGNVY